ncbi:MAG: YbaB/EbfC family nucleoid-associated protein, partial [Lentisphaerota bacterium]
MFGKLGDMANLMQKAQEMHKKMAEVQEEISKLEAKGYSAGNLVEAVACGDFTIKRITIKNECAKTGDAEIIQEHVATAVNNALNEIKFQSKEKMGAITGGMNIPGLNI